MHFDLLDFLARQGEIPKRAQYQLRPLRGGYWNQVIRVKGAEVDWIAKIYSQARPHSLFPILPEVEAAILRNLQGYEIAPEFVNFFPSCSNRNPAILLYQFIDGETWRNDVRPVARLFRRMHGLPTEIFGKLRPLATKPVELLREGDSFLDEIEQTKAAKSLRRKRPRVLDTPLPTRLSLVHVDSGSGNIVVSRLGPRLIDWQCPGLGDPVEDINCFLSPAFQSLYGLKPLTDPEVSEFLAAYDDGETVERYWALLPYLTYRMAAHCCLQYEQRRYSDPAGSAAYNRALEISLELL